MSDNNNDSYLGNKINEMSDLFDLDRKKDNGDDILNKSCYLVFNLSIR